MTYTEEDVIKYVSRYAQYNRNIDPHLYMVSWRSRAYFAEERSGLILQICKAEGIFADITTNYINFGDFCRGELGMQCQYGYYLLEGLAGHPSLKAGLRLLPKGEEISCYHSIKIHKDDAKIFKERVEKWRHSYD